MGDIASTDKPKIKSPAQNEQSIMSRNYSKQVAYDTHSRRVPDFYGTYDRVMSRLSPNDKKLPTSK